MDKEYLKSVFQNKFNRNDWQNALKEIFKSAEFFTKPQNLFEEHDKVKNGCQFGRIKLRDDQNIAVFEVELTGNVKIDRNRKGLREIAAKYIDQHITHGALVFFHKENEDDYRLIYIAKWSDFNRETGELKQSETASKRYTYLLGKNQSCNTAVARFWTLIGKRDVSLQDLTDAFSVEALNKEFYSKTAELFTELTGGTRGTGKSAKTYTPKISLPCGNDEHIQKEFAVRLIGRTVFCWFLKKKKSSNGLSLIPENILSADAVFITPEYYHAILEPLFFELLNTEVSDRKAEVMRIIPDAKYVPFLNGGLFEPHDKDYYYLKEQNNFSFRNTLKVPNEWFEDFFKLLESYNFTLDENSPTDIELSVDPEMLGRIFENLLAEINPETGETARKSTGSFYTPREIVDYMVTESLKQNLVNCLNTKEYAENEVLERRLSDLIAGSDSSGNLFSDAEKLKIVDALDKIKILDPACGSGAFPMGILHKMLTVLGVVDPCSKLWLDKQLAKIPDYNIRAITRKKLESENVEYVHKLGIIQSSIYGIDIQPIAVEIAKLRCFLSLIVDETIDDNAENRGILPLPNLEFKFVCANSLIDAPEEQNKETELFEVDTFFDNLKDKIKDYFNSHHKSDKEKIKEQILALIDIKVTEKYHAIQDQKDRQTTNKAKAKKQEEAQRQLAFEMELWSSYKNIFKNEPIDFFNIKYFFPDIENGFNVVIGNPPYVQLQKDHGRLAELYKDCKYQSFERTGDIYALFYESGINNLKVGGRLCFITSNKWMRAGYGKSLRKFFLTHNPELLIDCGPGVFENATVDVNILIIQRLEKRAEMNPATTMWGLTLDAKAKGVELSDFVNKHKIALPNMGEDAWFIGNLAEQNLKSKIEKIGKPLKDWDVNIYYGIKTGLNEAFIIDTETKERLCVEDPKSVEILKPILRGKDIKRYQHEWANLWLIATFPALQINIDDYSAIKNYLIAFGKDRLEQEGKTLTDGSTSRKKTGNKWFETQDQIAYYPEFEKEKIVWSDIATEPIFSLLPEGYFFNNTVYMIIGENNKYLSGILNSKAIKWFFPMISTDIGEKGQRFFKIFVEIMPIPPIIPANQSIVERIENIVDQILTAKKLNPNADTAKLEQQIDLMVYKLYELTYDDVKIVDPDFALSEEEWDGYEYV